jgi:glycosyl-4,4'-diaponeurosporenoate acyltransferase
LRIKRWKDRLPEAGALFAGGFSKRDLTSHDRAHLERFAAETRRAEAVHWMILATVVVFPLFVVWYALIPNVIYALAANVPFIMIQRYNRARLERIIARLDARRA